MIGRRAALITSLAIVGALAVALLAAPAQAALRHIDGTVISKSPESRSFRIATENGNRLRIKVDGATEFERIAGFGALHKGMRIEVEARRTDSGLLAKQVEPQGGGGGDDDGGGGDDGPNHT